MAKPLRRLTLEKKSIFVWGKEQKQCFETSKSVFETLGHFKLDATKTHLVTGARNVGLEARIRQEYVCKFRNQLFNMPLTSAERNYSTT